MLDDKNPGDPELENAELNSDPDPSEDSSDDETGGLTFAGDEAAEVDRTPRPEPTIRGKIDRFGIAMGTGRRKTGVARVRVRDGAGTITVNGRGLEDYFVVERDRLAILAPLKATDMLGKVDIDVNVSGGGRMGQAGSIVLGISRALQAKNPANHPILSEGGYLTRDSRMVERKKYGHKKARRSFQFSKR